MRRYDAIVVGAGAMGSSAAHELSKRGLKTITLERFTLNHVHGSSHGKSRIIRTAYAEHPSYVPLVKRAFSLWRELEKESGENVLTMTGGLMIGSPDSQLVRGALRSCSEHHLPHQVLSPSDVANRFPAFKLGQGEIAVFEDSAGFLFAEKAVEAMKNGAEATGAEFRFNEAVSSWREEGDSVVVRTPKGEYSARRLIISAGSWLPDLVPELRAVLECERQTVFWFRPRGREKVFTPSMMPIFIWDLAENQPFYGIPDYGEGFKSAQRHTGALTTPDGKDEVDREAALASLRSIIEPRIPDGNGPLISSTTCLYTNTPDMDFIVDFLPGHDRVVVLSPCSGHGFKFSSVIGEVAAQLVTTGKSQLDISRFRISRLAMPTGRRRGPSPSSTSES